MRDFETTNEGISLKCPSCGAPLRYDPQSQKFVCDTCKSKFSEDDLQRKNVSMSKGSQKSDQGFMDYICQSCGAKILADEHTTTDFCIYCGNPVVFRGRVVGALKPNYIIPFKISKDEAKNILKKYLKKYMFIPSSFFKKANLDKIAGVYYPFWEADIDCNGHIVAEGSTTSVYTTGREEITETRYYDIIRGGEIHLEDVTVNAFSEADRKLVESVLPYPIEEHKDFKMEYMSGFYAKKNDIELEDAKGRILSKTEEYSNNVLLNTINGYQGLQVINSNVEILNEHYDYTLLPIWIVSYKYAGKIWKFAINGVTGKVFGEVPLSKGKLAATFAGIASGLIAFLTLLGGVLL